MSDALVTPEAVALELEPAGLGSRAMALALDLAIEAAIVSGVLVGALLVGDAAAGWVAVVITLFTITAVVFGYPMLFEALWRGRTPGKAAFGLRVVTRAGAPPGWREASIRSVMLLVDLILTTASAGVLSILFTRDARRLGDLAAGTLVVRRTGGRHHRTPEAVTFSVPPGLEGLATTIDVGGLTDDDYHAVRRFLLRAPELPPDRRDALAGRLAGSLAPRVGATPRSDVTAEAFLQAIAARYQRR